MPSTSVARAPACSRSKLRRDGVVGEGEPARGGDVRGLVDRVDLVFGREALGDDLELQLADGTEHQRVRRRRLEHLDRAFLAQLLQALLQLLGLERVARARDAEEFRREIGDALERQRLAFGQRVADLQLAVVVDADDVAGDRVLARDALVGHEGQRVGELHLAPGAQVPDLHRRPVASRADAKERDAVAVPRVHVGLDLEDEAGERRLVRLAPSGRRRRAAAAAAPSRSAPAGFPARRNC